MTRHREIHVTVPASSANLGPGFDTLGLALARYDDIEAATADDGLVVEVVGEGSGGGPGGGTAGVPLDEGHLVVRAMRRTFDALGSTPPGLRLRCRNRIPHSRGLGSSAAASVAGAVAAAALLGREPEADRDLLLQVAASLEGHADNAAASLLGGFVVAWCQAGNNRPCYGAARLEPHEKLHPVALIPAEESSTAMTRMLLPDKVPLADAVFTASRTALGVCAFTTRPELLLTATEDRLHQPYRRPAYPASGALVDRLREQGIPAVISGAGPTVLALPADGTLPEGLVEPWFVVTPLPVDRRGAVVRTG
jgi:homoserine kinase